MSRPSPRKRSNGRWPSGKSSLDNPSTQRSRSHPPFRRPRLTVSRHPTCQPHCRHNPSLAIFPASGRIVPEIDQDNVREVIVGAYRVIYRLRGSEARIIMVHHAARLLDKRELGARG
ncbi:MAG: type II toxin-antitoxin system RelE/ParE family toxin [Dehalococcoidia bacterium]